MRDLINIMESFDLENDPLNFFWFHPETGMKAFGETEMDHATYAYEEIHGSEDDFNSEHSDSPDEEGFFWNAHQISKAIKDGWVRGRYSRKGRITNENELSLQGQRRNVHSAAKWFCNNKPVDTLYVELGEGTHSFWDLDESKLDGLKGERLEFFLKRGRVPSEMVSESFADTLKNHRGEMVDVFKNPSTKEWREAADGNEQVRAWLVGDDLYAWNCVSCLHRWVKDHFGFDDEAISLDIYGMIRGEIAVIVTDSIGKARLHDPSVYDDIMSHPFLRGHFTDVEVSYFDDAIVGDWRNQSDEDEEDEKY